MGIDALGHSSLHVRSLWRRIPGRSLASPASHVPPPLPAPDKRAPSSGDLLARQTGGMRQALVLLKFDDGLSQLRPVYDARRITTGAVIRLLLRSP
jgi:hypothetical protein